MADYTLSVKADTDLSEIYEYSWRAFGETKADLYFLGLRDALQLIADNPHLGRLVHDIAPGLRCHGYREHVVFLYGRRQWYFGCPRSPCQYGFKAPFA